MKTLNPLKVPFGTAKGVALRGARYLQWEDAFEVDFVDGLTFLEPHATIRKANKISIGAKPVRVELEEELKHGFFVHRRRRSRRNIRQRPDRRSLLVFCT